MRPRSPRELLEAAGVSAFLVSDLTNIRYLTGLSLTAGLLLVTPRRFLLFVDARYRERAEKCAREGISFRDLAEAKRDFQTLPECGYEAESVTVLRMQRWKREFVNTKFVHKRNLLAEFRRSKDEDELRNIRSAHRVTVELLRRVPSVLRRSITEERLARELQIWALELGADGLAFNPIVAFGSHTSIPHHEPTSRLLKRGHVVQVDVGAKFHGYASDRSEVYFTAQPTPLLERTFRALTEAKDAAKALAVPGVSTHALDRAARKVLRNYGLEEAFCHSLGHGVGLEIHEGVTLSEKQPERKILRNEVITIEPGVYFPGKFGMRLEEMVIVR